MRWTNLAWVVLLAGFLLAACSVWAQGEGETAAAPPAPEAAAAPATRPDAGTVTLRQIIEWGGSIGYVIIFLSVVTVTLFVLHLILLRRGRLCPEKLQKDLGDLIREKKLKESVEHLQKDPSLLARTIAAGFSRMRGGYAEMEEVMNGVAEDEAMRLEQSVGYFSLLAAIAPLLGLLGTVVGMVFAFNEIANRGVVTPKDLADPIQKALVTTVFGLLVAIPNVVCYTFFRNKLHRLLADMALIVEDLMMPFRGLKPQIKPIVGISGGASAAAARAAAKPTAPSEGEPEAAPEAGPDAESDVAPPKE